MLDLTIRVTESDYIRFNYWYNRWSLWLLNIFYFILIALCIILVVAVPKDAVMKVLLAVLIVFLIYFNTNTYFRSKKIYASDGFLQRGHTCEITSDDITVNSERSHAIVKWDEVYSFVETKEYFYIFISKLKAFIIPKRLMEDASMQELKQLATANIPASKLKLRR